MNDVARAAVCSVCRAPTPSIPPPLTWSPAVEDGRRVWTCADCARANLLSIEGRLDHAWW